MKRIRAEKRLRAKDVGTLPAGVYEDGGGLRLLVEPSGARRWVLRVTIAGKRCYRGLGPCHLVPLEKARDKATDIRRAAREGRDLVAQRRREGTTFRQAFEDHLEHRQKGMLNAKHAWQWRAGIEAHAFPVIGERPVSEITHDEIVAVLKPIWHETPETARRVLQRMEIIFKLAISRGLRERASPCTGVSEDLGKQRDMVEHHPAMPYAEVPAFIRTLRACSSRPVTKLALEWLVLTASRSGEARGARWEEIQGGVWVIPPERMKARQEHAVPLSGRCIEILKEARILSPDGALLFPGRQGKPLSDMALTQLMRRLRLDAVPHGFRSSFKDWAAEVAKVPDEVSEAALAHRIPNKVRAAYLRTQFLAERKQVMERWAAYCAT
jgi:integrase